MLSLLVSLDTNLYEYLHGFQWMDDSNIPVTKSSGLRKS